MFFIKNQDIKNIDVDNTIGFVNPTNQFTYHLIESYKKFFTIPYYKGSTAKIKHIVIFLDYKSNEYTKEIIDYLNENKVIYIPFSFDNEESIQQMITMRTLIHCNFYQFANGAKENMKSFNYIHNVFHNLLSSLCQYKTNHFFIVPDMVFNPNPKYVYKVDDFPNSKLKTKGVVNYSLIVNLINYYSEYFGLSLHKIFLPMIVQTQLNKFSVFNKSRQGLDVIRSVIDYEDLTDSFIKLFIDDKFKESFIITSDTYWSSLCYQKRFSHRRYIIKAIIDEKSDIIRLDNSFCKENNLVFKTDEELTKNLSKLL